MDALDAVAGSELATSAILAALVAQLQAKGLLSEDEVRAVYEHALLLLDQQRETSGPREVIDAARAVIEDQLRR